MDSTSVREAAWPDWFRLAAGDRLTRVAHLVPLGGDQPFCELDAAAFAGGDALALRPADRTIAWCRHCARAARRAGHRIARR